MANTYGKTSMEEFAAKALPELEDLLERFKDQNKPEAPEPETVKSDHDADGLSDDAERIDDLAHIIWHLANQIESIAYHSDDVDLYVADLGQCIRSRARNVRRTLRRKSDGDVLEDF